MINVHNRPIAMIIHKCITLIYIYVTVLTMLPVSVKSLRVCHMIKANQDADIQ